MFIVAVGDSSPEKHIRSEELLAYGLKAPRDGFIESRSTICGLDDFAAWSKQTVKERLCNTTDTPTTLGYKAVRSALEDLGPNSLDEIGLIIGDSATPIQTTPSEGQRIAGKLGLKIPSYDVTAGSGALIAHLDIVRKWKASRLTKLICCVSANTPTYSADYDYSTSQGLFADGASAVVLSNLPLNKRKNFEVIDTWIQNSSSSNLIDKIDIHAPIQIEDVILTSSLEEGILDAFKSLKQKYSSSTLGAYLISNQLCWQLSKKIGVDFGFESEKILSLGSSQGDMIGASLGYTLSKLKDSIPVNSNIFLVQSGIGLKSGYVLLKTVEGAK